MRGQIDEWSRGPLQGGLCWTLALFLVAIGWAFAGLSDFCFENCDPDRLTTAEQLLWGAIPLATAVLPIWAAVAMRWRWRADRTGRDLGRSLAVAVALVVYAAAVNAPLCAHVIDSSSEHDDGYFPAAMALTVLGWMILSSEHVLDRRPPTAERDVQRRLRGALPLRRSLRSRRRGWR